LILFLIIWIIGFVFIYNFYIQNIWTYTI
jgi:hypothetical protein